MAVPDRSGNLPEYIEKFAAVLVLAGFPPMPARVFVALLVSDSGRLSAAELVDLLQISPAAVSGAVRYLTGLALVHKERVPGSRREYYRMPADIWHQVFLLRNQVLVRWSGLLKEGIDIVGPDTPAGRRMTGHAEFFQFLAAEMPALMARWENAESPLPTQLAADLLSHVIAAVSAYGQSFGSCSLRGVRCQRAG
jgi:DNA-binding transcriptional ArsR family regulator